MSNHSFNLGVSVSYKQADHDSGKVGKLLSLIGKRSKESPNAPKPEKQMDMGEKVESEHTDNKTIAKSIATDHITENPKYYTKLESAGLADELKG